MADQVARIIRNIPHFAELVVRSVPFMSEPTRYHTAPLELPIDNWLFEAHPANGCGVCAALDRDLGEARRRGEDRKAFLVAAEIRNHPRDHR
jgi:hypothetical protein